MKKIDFSRAHFVSSIFHKDDLPAATLAEVALVGRSNVGKSSLINHLTNKKIAHTSSTPGKTQSINLYAIDQRCIFADLPGFGYAKVAHSIKEKWGVLLDSYFKNRCENGLFLILFLIDARRSVSIEDFQFLSWATHFQVPLQLVFTKCDKLAEHKVARNAEEVMKTVGPDLESPIYYTIKEARSRSLLTEKLNRMLANNGST